MVGINDMPTEVLEIILDDALPSSPKYVAAQAASVCSLWCAIIERTTFRTLRLSPKDIIRAKEILDKRPDRFDAVRRISFPVPFTTYRVGIVRSLTGRQVEISRGPLAALVAFLGAWPRTGKHFELKLYTDSVSLGGFGDFVQASIDYGGLVSSLYLASLQRPRPTEAPVVTKLSLIDFWGEWTRPICLCDHMRSFPELRSLELIFFNSNTYPQDSWVWREDMFLGLVKALDKRPDTLESIKLHFQYGPDPSGIWYDAGSLVAWLRHLTRDMSSVEVIGIGGDPELFWPQEVDATHPAPVWPKLKKWKLHYHISPDSDFEDSQFSGSDDIYTDFSATDSSDFYEDFDDNLTKVVAALRKTDLEDLKTFYSAVGKAITNMPKLETLEIRTSGRNADGYGLDLTIEGRTCLATWIGLVSPFFDEGVKKIWQTMADERGLNFSMTCKGSKLWD